MIVWHPGSRRSQSVNFGALTEEEQELIRWWRVESENDGNRIRLSEMTWKQVKTLHARAVRGKAQVIALLDRLRKEEKEKSRERVRR